MNNNGCNAKKWCLSIIGISLFILLAMVAIVYISDPYCYYRVPQNRFIVNNYRFLNAGLIKNADYDTVILGSSMTQNFIMDSFRKKLGQNPVKLSVGAMSIEGMELTYKKVVDIGKTDNVYVCIDLPSLNKEKDNLDTYATYLYDDTILNDYKYLIGYETWMRLLPLSMGLNLLDYFGVDLSSFYGTKNIDSIGEWHSGATYGKELLIKSYRKKTNQISKQNLDGIYNRMIENADKLIDIIYQNPDENFTFFFPPYSALLWHQSMQLGYYDVYKQAKTYIVERLSEKKNTKIFDFQSMDLICDLDNYKDLTHYSGDINELMVDCFANGNYSVSKDTISQSNQKLDTLIEQFTADNQDWLK